MSNFELAEPCIAVGNEAANLVGQAQQGFTIWRVIIPVLLLIGLSGFGFCLWIFGMLMFTFALDGASSQQLPNWLEPFMLVFWPLMIGVVVVVTPAFVAFGANWWQSLIAFGVSLLSAVVCYFGGVIALVCSLGG